MSRNDIIAQYGRERKIELICSRYRALLADDFEDFCQYIYEILCGMKEQQVVELYEKKQLDYYLLRIIRVQALSPKSAFNKLYDRNTTKITIAQYVSDILEGGTDDIQED